MDYRGTKVVWHGGAVFGFLTAVVLIPDRHVGFSIQINSEDGEIIRGLMYELLDHYLGAAAHRLGRALPGREAAPGRRGARGPQGADRKTRRRSAPRCPLERYTGTFADPWYGNIEITQADGKLSDRLQVDAAHGRHARALAVRHLRHAPRRQEHRAGLRDLRPRTPRAASSG